MSQLYDVFGSADPIRQAAIDTSYVTSSSKKLSLVWRRKLFFIVKVTEGKNPMEVNNDH